MVRFLRTASTANLFLAILVIVGYIIYGQFSGLDIYHCFLGIGPGHFLGRAGPIGPAWYGIIFVEAVIVITFFVGRWAEWNMSGHRLFCGMFGCLGVVFGILMAHLPQYNPVGDEQAVSVAIPSFDHVLAWYVWCSHIAYALIGPNVD